MQNYIEKYSSAVIRYRWLVLILAALMTGLWVFGASRLSVNTDLRIFFSKDNPQLLAFEALENTYTKNDNIFIAVSTTDGSIFSKENLRIIEELTWEAWKIPFSSRVESITNFQNSYADGDELIVEDLVRSAENLTEQDITAVKKVALSEPLLINRLITSSENVTGINIDVIKPDASANSSKEIADYARNLVSTFQAKYPQLDFHLTGWIMLDHTMGEAAERDMQTLIPAMFLLLVVVMAFCIKSLVGTLVTVVIIILSMITGMGVAGLMGIQITGPSSTAPAIILTLALADSIHFLLTIFYRMRQGDSREKAIAASLKTNMKPVFITSATTILGFLTMNFSDAPPFRDLGNIVAIGIAAAFIYSVAILPALVSFLLPKYKKSSTTENRRGEFFRVFTEFLIRRKNPVFISTVASIFILMAGISKIELNDDFIRYFDESYQYRVDSEFVMNNLTGLYTIEYSLESGKSKGIHEPEYLRTVEKFTEWYMTQPEVVNVNSLIPILKKLNKNINADDPDFYRIPADPSQIAQYLLLFELSLPFGLDLNNQINVDKSSLRVIVSLQDVTANDVRAIDERAQQWLRANAPAYMHTEGTGLAVMYAHLSERNIKSMLGATFSMLVLISLILVVAFRSVKFGLISLLPNLMPAVMAFGVWGLTMERIGIPASVLISLAVGIVVDDTVHFISKYLDAKRNRGMSTELAIHYTFETVGRALLVTTITLACGFALLSISGYKPNSDMGIMTCIIVCLALIFDFLFLPTLILKMEGFKGVRDKETAAVSDFFSLPAGRTGSLTEDHSAKNSRPVLEVRGS